MFIISSISFTFNIGTSLSKTVSIVEVVKEKSLVAFMRNTVIASFFFLKFQFQRKLNLKSEKGILRSVSV